MGGSQNCWGSQSRGRTAPIPRSRLQASPPWLRAPRKARKRPEEVGRPRADAPGPRRPRPCPAGCPHLAKESPESLAVELHLQPGPRDRFRDPSPRSPSALSLDGGCCGPNFPSGPRPRPFPGSNVHPRPTPWAQPGSARSLITVPRRTVSAHGTVTRLAGGKLGDICEERNRKDPRRGSKGGRRYWRCSGERVSRRMY